MPPSNRRPLYSPSEFDAPALEGAGSFSSAGEGRLQPQDAADEPPRLLTMQPCTLKGLSAALSAGVLGYMFGFVPGVIRHRASKWALIHLDGIKSAQSLAVMSGAYTAVHCICHRIRQVEDGWNRGLAGCATGLALGWSNGPMGAMQSCLGIGGLSYLLDFGGTSAAEARDMSAPWHNVTLDASSGSSNSSSLGGRDSSSGPTCTTSSSSTQGKRGQALHRAPLDEINSGGGSSGERNSVGAYLYGIGGKGLLPGAFEQRLREFAALPPITFLGECARVAYFDGCGSGSGCQAWPVGVAHAAAPGDRRRPPQ